MGLRGIFNILHSLAPIFREPRVGGENISNRRLELFCDDGSYHIMVLDKLKVD